jgi:predicted tellurium resistance membrane protein TerC
VNRLPTYLVAGVVALLLLAAAAPLLVRLSQALVPLVIAVGVVVVAVRLVFFHTRNF